MAIQRNHRRLFLGLVAILVFVPLFVVSRVLHRGANGGPLNARPEAIEQFNEQQVGSLSDGQTPDPQFHVGLSPDSQYSVHITKLNADRMLYNVSVERDISVAVHGGEVWLSIADLAVIDPENFDGFRFPIDQRVRHRIVASSKPGGLTDVYFARGDPSSPNISLDISRVGPSVGGIYQYDSSHKTLRLIGGFQSEVVSITDVESE